jgi:hypothetical protein
MQTFLARSLTPGIVPLASVLSGKNLLLLIIPLGSQVRFSGRLPTVG